MSGCRLRLGLVIAGCLYFIVVGAMVAYLPPGGLTRGLMAFFGVK